MERTLPHGEVGKPTSAVGIASSKAVPRRGGVRRQRAVGAGADYPGLLEGSCRDAIAALADLPADPYSVSEGAVFTDEPSGKLTLVYGVAHLKDGLLTLSVDCRYPVTMDGTKLESDLCAAWAKMGLSVKEFDLPEPFYIPVDAPRMVALQALYKDVTGRDDPPYAMGGCTYFRAVPGAISFGLGMPGTNHDYSAFLPKGHGGGHGPDEVLSVNKMLTLSRICVAALAELDVDIE